MTKVGYKSKNYACSVCKCIKTSSDTEKVLHCSTCKYDLCPACLKNSKKTKTQAKDMPCGKCGDALKKRTEIPTDYTSERYYCNVCGGRSKVVSEDEPVWHCDPCQYDACPSCFVEWTRKSRLCGRCCKDLTLQGTVYKYNGYICNICGNNRKASDQSKVAHCSDCSWDVCPDCLKR